MQETYQVHYCSVADLRRRNVRELDRWNIRLVFFIVIQHVFAKNWQMRQLKFKIARFSILGLLQTIIMQQPQTV